MGEVPALPLQAAGGPRRRPFPSPLKVPTLRPLETSPPFDPEGILHRLWSSPLGEAKVGFLLDGFLPTTL